MSEECATGMLVDLNFDKQPDIPRAAIQVTQYPDDQEVQLLLEKQSKNKTTVSNNDKNIQVEQLIDVDDGLPHTPKSAISRFSSKYSKSKSSLSSGGESTGSGKKGNIRRRRKSTQSSHSDPDDLLENEKFDFDIITSPSTQDDSDDEVFAGRITYKEIVAKQARKFKKPKPLRPLTTGQLVEVFKEATKLAIRLETSGVKKESVSELPSTVSGPTPDSSDDNYTLPDIIKVTDRDTSDGPGSSSLLRKNTFTISSTAELQAKLQKYRTPSQDDKKPTTFKTPTTLTGRKPPQSVGNSSGRRLSSQPTAAASVDKKPPAGPTNSARRSLSNIASAEKRRSLSKQTSMRDSDGRENKTVAKTPVLDAKQTSAANVQVPKQPFLRRRSGLGMTATNSSGLRSKLSSDSEGPRSSASSAVDGSSGTRSSVSSAVEWSTQPTNCSFTLNSSGSSISSISSTCSADVPAGNKKIPEFVAPMTKGTLQPGGRGIGLKRTGMSASMKSIGPMKAMTRYPETLLGPGRAMSEDLTTHPSLPNPSRLLRSQSVMEGNSPSVRVKMPSESYHAETGSKKSSIPATSTPQPPKSKIGLPPRQYSFVKSTDSLNSGTRSLITPSKQPATSTPAGGIPVSKRCPVPKLATPLPPQENRSEAKGSESVVNVTATMSVGVKRKSALPTPNKTSVGSHSSGGSPPLKANNSVPTAKQMLFGKLPLVGKMLSASVAGKKTNKENVAACQPPAS